MDALVARLKAKLAWIDLVPRDATLPAMPGFDRDYVENLAAEPEDFESKQLVDAIDMTDEWIAAVPREIKGLLVPVPE